MLNNCLALNLMRRELKGLRGLGQARALGRRNLMRRELKACHAKLYEEDGKLIESHEERIESLMTPSRWQRGHLTRIS